ncbi:major facilitator superfamily domain-containing protein [Xylogone sp. PMI_703]|nr:major facilitator superfamily domain-containing protein [Xylogone sp. PMI_703]
MGVQTVPEEHLNIDIEHAENAHTQGETESYQLPNMKLERRLLLKLDFTVLPLLAGSFLIAYLDRNNIGNARVMGMQNDLLLSDKQFFNCLMIFFIGYIVLQLPANLAMRVVAPSYQIGSGACILFGVCSMSLAAARNYGPVMGLRVLIGIWEAFVQVGLLYISIWYKRDESATRAAIYYTTATVSGCISSLVAYGIDKNLDGVCGYHSWQWLYMLEGAPAIALGLLIILLLPPLPEIAATNGCWPFDKEELELAVQRMDIRQIWVGLRDYKVWLMAITYCAPCLGISSINSFLPTFIRGFGFGPVETQLLSMIPYAVATITLLSVCVYSDRINQKGLMILGCNATSCVGYIILMTTTTRVALVAGTCFVAASVSPGLILAVSWTTINTAGYTELSTAWAVAQLCRQAGGIIGTQVYRGPPRFIAGHATVLGFLVAGAATSINILVKRTNLAKDTRAQRFAEHRRLYPEAGKELEELGDNHPNFRYIV